MILETIKDQEYHKKILLANDSYTGNDDTVVDDIIARYNSIADKKNENRKIYDSFASNIKYSRMWSRNK
jgi:hypothetical protein